MQLRLDGRVALVTGGSRGIGAACATAFAAAGAKVVVASRKREAVDAAVASMEAATGSEVAGVVSHAGDPLQARAAVQETIRRFGACDVLVNNAATNPYLGATVGIPLSAADKTWEVNLRGPLVHVQAAHELWMREHGGVVINIASIGGFMVEPGIGFYNTTKAALVHLTRQLARELAPDVRVNAIAPGLVKTDMARALWEPNEAAMAAAVPMRRLGVPGDVASAALFLACDASAWTTGHTLVVDGGAMLAGW